MAKIKGLGTQLKATIGGTLTAIAQRVEIDPNETTIEMVEITDLDSALVERGPTLPDAGELALKVWLDPADTTHQFLRNQAQTPPTEPVPFALVFPTSPVYTGAFNAYVSSWKEGTIDPKGYLQADCKLTLTSLVTWTSGA